MQGLLSLLTLLSPPPFLYFPKPRPCAAAAATAAVAILGTSLFSALADEDFGRFNRAFITVPTRPGLHCPPSPVHRPQGCGPRPSHAMIT